MLLFIYLLLFLWKVLVQAGFNWVYSRDGNVPAHAVSSGHTSDGETLYVGRVHHNGACTVGKVWNSRKTIFNNPIIYDMK